MESVAVDLQLSLRRRIVAELDPLLTDREIVPEPAVPIPTEEEPLPCRVCDEAYLALRKLLAHDEDEMTQELNANEFLAQGDEAKDAEISRARESGTWTNWLNG